MCEFQNRIQVWLEGAQKIIDEHYKQDLPNLWASGYAIKLEISLGKKYAKIVAVNPSQRSAFAFIDMNNGDVLKPACWSRPAKHARGNIFNNDDGLNCVNPYGIEYLK